MSVHPIAVTPDICLGFFLELDHEIYLNFCMVPETLKKLSITTRFCGKIFHPKNWGNWAIMTKHRVFWINFHCICSILKLFICWCSCTNPIFGKKSFSWDIGQNPPSQSDCRISKWTISPEQIDETVSFLACWYGQSCQDSKIELTNGINLLFACWYNLMKIKLKVLVVGMVKNGCGQSCDGTSKLNVYLTNEQMD